jgi:hypothetical protein
MTGKVPHFAEDARTRQVLDARRQSRVVTFERLKSISMDGRRAKIFSEGEKNAREAGRSGWSAHHEAPIEDERNFQTQEASSVEFLSPSMGASALRA